MEIILPERRSLHKKHSCEATGEKEFKQIKHSQAFAYPVSQADEQASVPPKICDILLCHFVEKYKKNL